MPMFPGESSRYSMDKPGLIPISRLDGSEIANLFEIVGDINRCIVQLQNDGDEQVAEILRDIGVKVLMDPRMAKKERRQAIRNVRKLAWEASLPSKERKAGTARGDT
jgi:hypothetical protein